MGELVSISEALGMVDNIYSHAHVASLVRKGKINGRKSGTVWLVDFDSFKAYVDQMEELGPNKHDPKPNKLTRPRIK